MKKNRRKTGKEVVYFQGCMTVERDWHGKYDPNYNPYRFIVDYDRGDKNPNRRKGDELGEEYGLKDCCLLSIWQKEREGEGWRA